MAGQLKAFFGALARDTQTERYTFELAVPIKDHEGQVAGVLHRVYIAKDFFINALETITFGDTGHVMLIDSNGVVLTCPILPTGHQLADPELVKAVTGPLRPGLKPRETAMEARILPSSATLLLKKRANTL